MERPITVIDVKELCKYTKDLTLLYVEDDISQSTSTKELLGNYFKNIDTAMDGKEGLDKYFLYMKENATYYDLVITDISMPKLTGIEMSRAILEKNSTQPIIITTAHNDIEFLTEAIDIGVEAFVTKPITGKQLTKALYKVSKYIHMLNEDKAFIKEATKVVTLMKEGDFSEKIHFQP